MIISKIARRAYKRARQNPLSSFAENVYKRMNGVAAYAAIQNRITDFAAPLAKYQDNLAASHNRGMADIVAKNLAKAEVLRHLNLIADDLEMLAADNPQLIVDAGFVLKQNGNRNSGKPQKPVIKRAYSTGKKGELRVLIEDSVPGAVRTHAFRYSLDRGATWTNASYNSRRSFVLRDLPQSSELWLQAQAIGYGDNVSDWSEPAVAAVL